MAGIKINQYPLERLTFGDEDYYDIDYWTGSSYETAKIKGSVIKSGIASGLVTLYANDGTLTGDRAVSGAGTNSLALGNNVLNENLSFFKVNSTQGLEQFANAFPITNAGLEVIKNPANFIANVKSSATDYSQFRLQSDEFIVNSFLGTNNYMHSSTPALSSTIISDGGAGTNSRLLLYGSGRVDLGTTGSVGAYITLDTSNTFTDRNTTPKGLEYTLDYSANFTNRSLVDKEYVDNNAGGDSIYTANDTIGAGRVATLTDSLGIKTANTTSGFYVEKSTNTDKVFEVRGNGSGNWFNTSSSYVGIGEGVALTHSRFTNDGLDIYEGAIRKFRFQSGGNELINLFEDGSINGTGSHFVINSNAVIGTEKISLQSSTAIKGIGTSTGSALAIYNNDTTPFKLWDFLDNGKIIRVGAVSIGENQSLTDARTVSLGKNVSSSGFDTVSIGQSLTTSDNYTTNIGSGNTVSGTVGLCVGAFSTITGTLNFGFGSDNFLTGTKNIGIGLRVYSAFSDTIGIGKLLLSNANGASLIGYGVSTANRLTNSTADSLALGWNTTTPQYLFASTGASIDAELNMNNNRISNTIVNPSVQETTSTATFTINADEETTGVLTAMASATTIASPTGAPVQGQSLIIRLKDDGTARAITWNAIFRGIGITLPTTTTANKLLYIGCMYNSTDTKWDIIALKEEA